jgi:hypothetical protein
MRNKYCRSLRIEVTLAPGVFPIVGWFVWKPLHSGYCPCISHARRRVLILLCGFEYPVAMGYLLCFLPECGRSAAYIKCANSTYGMNETALKA